MNEKLYCKIKKHEEKGDFTHALITKGMIKEAEEKLNLELPIQYKEFLKKFGHGLQVNLIVIENCDEWLYCVNAKDGKIVIWTNRCKEVTVAYNDFDEYLEDRVQDILENM